MRTSAPTLISLVALTLASPLLAASPQGGTAACLVEQVRVTPPDVEFADQFGVSMDFDGDTLVVGDRSSTPTALGSVHVFVRTGSGWTRQAELVGSGLGDPTARFGNSVAVDGDTILVGASVFTLGRVHAFVRSGTTWTEQAVLSPSPSPQSSFGAAVAVSGDRAVVGALNASLGGGGNTGAAYVFVRSGTTWSQESLLPVTGGTQIGYSVDIDGDRVVVGAPTQNFPFPQGGGAAVFVRQGSTWILEADLEAGTPEGNYDGFGRAVSIQGDRVLVGAPSVSTAYVYDRSAGAWSLTQELTAAGVPPFGLYGNAVALDGDRALVGAPKSNSVGTSSGRVHVFERSGATWTEQAQLIGSDTAAFNSFGERVAASGGTVVATAPGAAGANLGEGAAYIFEAPAAPVSYCTAGTTASGCQASISATGCSSASQPTGFVIGVLDVEGAKDGILFFGANGRQANPWGNGSSFQCVTPPVSRTGLQAGVGTPSQCNGFFSLDFNTWMTANPLKVPATGTTVQAQCWFRDPLSTSNQTTSLSNALEFEIGL